jgi:hypothetical protein
LLIEKIRGRRGLTSSGSEATISPESLLFFNRQAKISDQKSAINNGMRGVQ